MVIGPSEPFEYWQQPGITEKQSIFQRTIIMITDNDVQGVGKALICPEVHNHQAVSWTDPYA